MKINENLIRISAGKIPIDQELLMDQDIKLLVIGSIVKYEDASNQDGTVDRTYIVKGIIAEYVK